MSKPITSFVGMDAHADSIAIGIAPSGQQEPHFVGTTFNRAAGPFGRIAAGKRRATGWVLLLRGGHLALSAPT